MIGRYIRYGGLLLSVIVGFLPRDCKSSRYIKLGVKSFPRHAMSLATGFAYKAGHKNTYTAPLRVR
jgi:hypothetical protein